MKYIVLSGMTERILEEYVNEHISRDWRPSGGIAYDSSRKLYIQAMVKE